ncbi:uroporphyrinogen-III synthase [Isoalcanivorax beigongshangi]|uniref:Uroporphyrinogen-III synthase n=1 Tax=Isoalcanivorax beigongshangi TaxID=3238810 RepID=A0ABV4AEQ6_9GAMM
MTQHVLVTRPQGQQHAIMALLQAAGFHASHQPTLTLSPLPLAAADRTRLLDLDQYQGVFFVSPNAVRFGVEALRDFWPQWPVDVHWLAVGDATAAALRAEGLDVISPPTGFNSEAVLELPQLQHVAGWKVLVLCGDGGRMLLTETLRARGAEVDRVALYQRDCAKDFKWPPEKLAAALVTSVESWQCLLNHSPDPEMLYVAGSARIGAAIGAAGFERIAVADSPHDEDMVACLIQHLSSP